MTVLQTTPVSFAMKTFKRTNPRPGSPNFLANTFLIAIVLFPGSNL